MRGALEWSMIITQPSHLVEKNEQLIIFWQICKNYQKMQDILFWRWTLKKVMWWSSSLLFLARSFKVTAMATMTLSKNCVIFVVYFQAFALCWISVLSLSTSCCVFGWCWKFPTFAIVVILNLPPSLPQPTPPVRD